MLPFAISGPHLIVEEDCVNTVRLDVGDEVLKFDEDDVSRLEIWQLTSADPSAKRLR